MKNKLLPALATGIIVIGLLVYLVSASFGDTMIYYKTVAELLAETQKFEDRPIRINGVLVPDSIRQKPGTDQFRFQVKKEGSVLDVEYAGILPDAMQPGKELVVQGVLPAGKKIFQASQILTKCPSKYEAEAQSRVD